MIRAHGGSKDIMTPSGAMSMSGLIKDTMVNSPKDVKEKFLSNLISKTTGVGMARPVMDGVIRKTTPESKAVPEHQKVPAKEVGKTNSKMGVGVPFSGPKSGYGKAKK